VARPKISGTNGLLLWAVPGAVCASAWLLDSLGWDSYLVFAATWSLGLAALVLVALRVRAVPEILGLGLGVGIVLLLIALDNRRFANLDAGDWTTYVPIENGSLGVSCSDCHDPWPFAIAGAALVAASVGGYALLRRRYR
jgi:uncharacterized membrane protein